jgi:uncharacterized membrane protein
MTRLTGMLVLVVFLAAVMAGAQTTRQPQVRETDPIAALTAEFRALRAELAETARASLRLQLLVARVQAQEQRIIYLDRQRAEAATRRSNAEQGIAAMASGMPSANAAGLSKLPPEQRRDFERMIEMQREQLAQQEQALAQMRVEENDAANALAQEQSRWSDLNSRLDELERSLR